METKTFSDPSYTAGRAVEKRRRILKKLRVNRNAIAEILARDEENIVKIPEDADEATKKTLKKIIADQRRAIADMKERVKELEALEKIIGDCGFNLNDFFNGVETTTTLSPAGKSIQ